MTGFTEYTELDATGLAAMVRDGEVSPSELVEEAIARIEALNPVLNAVITPMYEEARAGAAAPVQGPFAGVPYLMKDLFYASTGTRLTNGSRFFRDYVPDYDSEMTIRTRRAGLITVGKTNVPEFGLAPITEPEAFGPTNNPWDLARTPGGSSGGAGAAVAARIVPMAQASDGGGSIRIPASCCSLFGLKPTRARTPTGPYDTDTWLGASVGHVLTRSVRDCAAMLDALAGPEPAAVYYAPPPERPFLDEVGTPPGRLRIAYTAEPLLGELVDPECVAALERAVDLMRSLGHEVKPARPQFDRRRVLDAFLLIVAAGTAVNIRASEEAVGRMASHRDFETETWLLALVGTRHRADAYVDAMSTLRALAPTCHAFLQDHDVLMTPTLGQPPILTGSVRAKGATALLQKFLVRFDLAMLTKALHGIDPTARRIFDFIPFTPLFNLTGQPAMSVPLEWTDDGLPVGIQFAGRYGDEATLLRLAAQLEDARPWANRKPPVCAGA